MYTSLLTQIKNAQKVRQEKIRYPHSKSDERVLSILAENKFIDGFEKKGKGHKKFFEIALSYKDNSGAIRGTRLVSKPSRKIYKKYSQFRSVKQGYGLAVISTSKGVMTSKEARKQKVGGEVMFEIW